MPRKGERWTAQERIFVNSMAASGDKTYSAARAGYKQPHIVGHTVANRPAVQAEIARLQLARLFDEALPLAVERITQILKSDKAPAGAQVQAAKLVFDRTLGLDEAMKGKDPHEMSPDELARALAELKRIASERARPVIDLEPAEESDIFG